MRFGHRELGLVRGRMVEEEEEGKEKFLYM